MPRIYFDTNIFSNLRSNKEQKFQEFNRLLEVYKERFSFFFSYAHIRDKRKDLTEHKFDDFKFMEGFVHDNYLAYHPIEKNTSFYLATPLMVFEDNPNNDLDGLLNFFDPHDDDDDIIKTLKSTIKQIYSTIPLPIQHYDFDLLPHHQKELMIAMLGVKKEDATYFDLMQNMSGFTRRLFSESDLYKNLRDMVYDGLNKGKITINDTPDFNEALKDSPVGKTFLEFVKSNMTQKDKDNIPFYDFYMSSYNLLDIFGISKDKVNAKNTPNNMLTDGMHTYFARYCDYLVTDDSIIAIKANALYRLFGFETKVISSEAFIKLLPEILIDWPDDNDWFKQKLVFDLQQSERKDLGEINGKTVQRLLKNHLYLDFFDAVLDVKDDQGSQIIIFKSDSNALSEPNFFETSQIIDRALVVFGIDLHSFGKYDHHSNARGQSVTERHWEFSCLSIALTNDNIIKKYAIVLTVIAKTSD